MCAFPLFRKNLFLFKECTDYPFSAVLLSQELHWLSIFGRKLKFPDENFLKATFCAQLKFAKVYRE